MKIVINENDIKETPERLLMRAGYSYHRGRGDKDSMARRVGRSNFPRFHAYIYREGGRIIINLHLDQKRPSYSGTSAHSGEYDSEVVENEAERIKNYITHNT